MKEIGVGKIASVMGRFYAMDRDNIWDRVEKAYAAIVYGEGIQADNAVEAVKASYETVDEDGKHLTDEFVLPTVIGGSEGRVKADDSVIFFNFRPDRAREITRTFVDPDFNGFERKNGFFNSVPNIVTVHSVKSAHYGSDFTYAYFLHFILKFIEIFNGR